MGLESGSIGDTTQTSDDADDEISKPIETRKFLTRSDFESADDYARYIRTNVQIGMKVRCISDFEEVREGDIGRVIKVYLENWLIFTILRRSVQDFGDAY